MNKEKRLGLPSFYDHLSNELINCGGKVEVKFFDRTLLNWRSYGDGTSTFDLRFDLVKGIILRINEDEVGVALGWGKDEKDDQRYLRLQFGGQPVVKRDFRDVRELRNLVVGGLTNFSIGEFFDDGIKIRPNLRFNIGSCEGMESDNLGSDSIQTITYRIVHHQFPGNLT